MSPTRLFSLAPKSTRRQKAAVRAIENVGGFQASIFIRIGARMQALYPWFADLRGVCVQVYSGLFLMP
jgi:hypothetical protein